MTVEFAADGIRCNNVRPGFIVDPVRDRNMSDETRQLFEGMHVTRLATASDVANAVLFLASSEAEVVSGITIPVDGGSSAVRGLTLG